MLTPTLYWFVTFFTLILFVSPVCFYVGSGCGTRIGCGGGYPFGGGGAWPFLNAAIKP